MVNVFIDGSQGTTGLLLHERLCARADITLLTLPEVQRKDAASRKELLNRCDVAFLCLPDDASREAVQLIENPAVCVFDTSTAHRTAPDWVYGFPELGRTPAICASNRIAVPGCHASGFAALVQPLIAAGLLEKNALLSCFSVTGYTGGGKKMIAQYEADNAALQSPRQYALGQTHKHLAEMTAVCELAHAPVFCPVVANYPRGMVTTIPLFAAQLRGTKRDVIDLYRQQYQGPVVRYVPEADEGGFLAADTLSGCDGMQISVGGNDERLLLLARFDNLGKGASGAAVQCMNLKLGLPQETGLHL